MLHRLFGFQGRLGRRDFLAHALLMLGAVGAATFALVLLAMEAPPADLTETDFSAPILLLPLAILALWSAVALGAQRLHDMDRSALHLLWIYGAWLVGGVFRGVPLLGLFVALVPLVWLCGKPGTPGPNRYGPSPGPAA